MKKTHTAEPGMLGNRGGARGGVSELEHTEQHDATQDEQRGQSGATGAPCRLLEVLLQQHLVKWRDSCTPPGAVVATPQATVASEG